MTTLPNIDEHPWHVVWGFDLGEFVLAMLDTFGRPVETMLVGAFNDEGRGAQRDMELDMHQDGIRDPALAARQGGSYVENPDVDVVGMYCLRDNPECVTRVVRTDVGPAPTVHRVVLGTGEALLFDNRRVRHARVGPVGDRVLMRVWMTRS